MGTIVDNLSNCSISNQDRVIAPSNQIQIFQLIVTSKFRICIKTSLSMILFINCLFKTISRKKQPLKL